MSNRVLSLDDIDVFRLYRGLSVAAIAREIGVSADVYRVNILGRMMNGKFVKTEPYDYNAAKFDRFIREHEAEITEAVDNTGKTVTRPAIEEDAEMLADIPEPERMTGHNHMIVHGDQHFTLNAKEKGDA